MSKPDLVDVPTNAEVIDFTFPDAIAVSKGSLCVISGAAGTRGAYPSTLTSLAMPFAGIASVDKEALDGQTEVGLYPPGTNVIIDISMVTVASGVPANGELVEISGQDTLRQLLTELSKGSVVGKAIETPVATIGGEVII